MKITDANLKQIYTHAAEIYPHECCGFLLGSFEQGGLVYQTRRAVNQSRRANQFTISAEAFAQAWLTAEQSGQTVIGIYHSHPDCPAIPSQTDLENAWADAFFLITAIYQSQPLHVNVWQLAGNGPRRFEPVPLEIVDPKAILHDQP